MTGYGKAEDFFADNKIIVEIKTLNSKQLDASIRLPQALRGLELELRNRIAGKLQRGKIDMTVTMTGIGDDESTTLNKDVIASYYEQMKDICFSLQIKEPDDVASVLFKLHGIYNTPEAIMDDELTNKVLNTAEAAIDIVDDFRVHEGNVLKTDLLNRVDLILNYLSQVEPLEQTRIDTIREHMLKNLADIADKCTVDKNRFEQELIFYLEKLDITEEKVRLRKHCQYFGQCIDEDFAGKKLAFVVQEMGREINTLGSKANQSDIQRLVVMMKDELEKIKEQLFNIL